METTTKSSDKRRGRSAASPQWRMVVVVTPDPAQAGVELKVAETLTIGRSAKVGVDLVVADAQLSRHHLTIRRRGRVFEVEDAGSKNGTFVDGQPILGPTRLGPGQIVRAGETILQLDHEALLPPGIPQEPDMRGGSPQHFEALHDSAVAARGTLPTLIQGETGTGKELIARRLHRLGQRSGELLSVNCAAIPAALAEAAFFGHRRGAYTSATADELGFFTKAHGGTLFLDEVGELATTLQPKLLRVLETGELSAVGSAKLERVAVRVVSATQVDLEEAVEAGSFRRDLLARLAGFVVRLAPLRERRRDVPDLFVHFLGQAAPGWRPALSAKLLEALMLHSWPMNLRELRTVAHRVAALHRDRPALDLDDLEGIGDRILERRTPEKSAPDRDELEELLTRYKGNIGRICQHLGKHRQQIYRWLTRYELDVDAYR